MPKLANKILPALIAAKVAELADALDSGSSSRKAVGVQVPPFALLILMSLFVLSGATACASRHEAFFDEQDVHLQAALSILAAHPGDTDAVCADLDRYMEDNQERLMDARALRSQIWQGLSAQGRDAFAREADKRQSEVRQRLMTTIKTFPEPARIMKRIRELYL